MTTDDTTEAADDAIEKALEEILALVLPLPIGKPRETTTGRVWEILYQFDRDAARTILSRLVQAVREECEREFERALRTEQVNVLKMKAKLTHQVDLASEALDSAERSLDARGEMRMQRDMYARALKDLVELCPYTSTTAEIKAAYERAKGLLTGESALASKTAGEETGK